MDGGKNIYLVRGYTHIGFKEKEVYRNTEDVLVWANSFDEAEGIAKTSLLDEAKFDRDGANEPKAFIYIEVREIKNTYCSEVIGEEK